MSKLLIFVLLASLSTWAQSSSSGGNVSVSGSPAANDCVKFVSATVITTTGAACAAGGAGTVTSVGFTGGLISVGTPTSTPAFTVAGTSGGIPYFDTAASWATSALLTNHAIVLGGGAGAAPTVLGSLGTTTTVLHGAAAGAPTFSQVTSSDIDSSVAPINSPTFTGSPVLPTGTTGTTQSASDNSTKLATTAYVDRVAPVTRYVNTANQDITAVAGAPAAITALAFSIPSLAGAQSYAFHCSIVYSQGTTVAGDGFAVGVATNNPTRLMAQATIWFNGTTGVVNKGIAVTTTGYQNFTTVTPGSSGVNYPAVIDGTLEEPSSTANTLNFGAFTGNVSDVITIIRGSWCSVTPTAN